MDLKLSELKQFNNSNIWGKFVNCENNTPVSFRATSCIIPYGVQVYGGGSQKSLVLELNPEEHHELIKEINCLYKTLADKHTMYNITHPIVDTHNSRIHLKIKIDADSTRFYDENSVKTDDETLFKAKSIVNVLFTCTLMWVRNKDCGLTFKCRQIRVLSKSQQEEEEVVCVI